MVKNKMEQTYKIVGIQSSNGSKKLELRPLESIVTERESVNPLEAIKNLNSLVQRTQQMYSKNRIADIIRVSDKTFKDMDLKIDGTFTIKY